MKRAFDVFVALSVLSICLPLLVLAAVAVKVDGRGPVLYRARRVGLRGRSIEVLKFRTMVPGADAAGSVTVGSDRRITRLGRFLRAAKIDELPQLWNIVRGDMSIVGPRPESLDVVENYYSHEDRELFTVRPGLTCPGNLLYYVFHEHLVPPPGMHGDVFYGKFLLRPKLLADLYYVRNRSFAYDLELILLTIQIMFVKMMGKTPRWEPRFSSTPPEDWRGDTLLH